MVSRGKSRTTGCTRAEYDRPVSLRSRASWIPARKSCASRIIGDLAVRPIAVSTSRSIEASVPSTISSVTGSGPFMRRPDSPGHPSGFPGPLRGHDQVAEPVDLGPEPRVERDGGPVLLHHRRPLDPVPGPQVLPSIDRRVDIATRCVEAGGPGAHGPSRGAGRQGAEGGADAGDAEVDPLDLLGGVVAERVAVEALVGVVEGGDGGLGDGGVDRAVGNRDPDLEGLAEVA